MFSFHIKEHMSVEHIHHSGIKMILIMHTAPFIFSLCSLGFYLCWQCANSTSRILFQSTYFLSKQQDSLRCCTPTGRSDITEVLGVDGQNHQWQVTRRCGTDGWWEIIAALQSTMSRSILSYLPDDRLVGNIWCEMVILIHTQTCKQWLQHYPRDKKRKRHAEADIWSTLQRATTFFSFSSYMRFIIMVVSHHLGNFLPS